MSTSYDANTHLMKNQGDHVGQAEYAKIIGSMIHLMNFSRPDIAYAMCRLSTYTHNPNNDHWSALSRLMKYLRGTMNYGYNFTYKFKWVLSLRDTYFSTSFLLQL